MIYFGILVPMFGIYSIYAAKLNNLKVISFEPIASSYHTLIKNIKNPIQKKKFCLSIGFQAILIKMDIYFESDHSGSAGHELVALIQETIIKISNNFINETRFFCRKF